MGWLEQQLGDDYAAWRAELTEEEVDSLLWYQGEAHAIVNQFFRSPDEVSEQLSERQFEIVEKATYRIDTALLKGRLTRAVRCYRGLPDFAAFFEGRSDSEIISLPFEEWAIAPRQPTSTAHDGLLGAGEAASCLPLRHPLGRVLPGCPCSSTRFTACSASSCLSAD